MFVVVCDIKGRIEITADWTKCASKYNWTNIISIKQDLVKYTLINQEYVQIDAQIKSCLMIPLPMYYFKYLIGLQLKWIIYN